MKTSKLVAELISAGCVLLCHGSRHDIWKNPKTGQKASVPRHGSQEIPTGTEQSIRNLLGVPKRK